MPFKEGDLVELKSGGVCMVVASIEGNNVFCIWQEKVKSAGEMKPMSHEYPAVVLKPWVERKLVF
jgi:uncharacterized protein YodC (DUF2158 family)